MFVTEEDYRVVIGDTALKVISQVSTENRANAEAEAQEEIAGYLRPKYDTGGRAKPAHCDVYLRHRALSHERSHAAEDGERDTKGTLRPRH